MNWKAGADEYLSTLAATGETYGLPPDLLSRVAFQESSWRPAVIDGSVPSKAGAIGMFQLEPQYFPGAGQSWQADAVRAAEYLCELYHRFDDDWSLAIAGYNWGPTALEKWLKAGSDTTQMPIETLKYVAGVCADVRAAGGVLST